MAQLHHLQTHDLLHKLAFGGSLMPQPGHDPEERRKRIPPCSLHDVDNRHGVTAG